MKFLKVIEKWNLIILCTERKIIKKIYKTLMFHVEIIIKSNLCISFDFIIHTLDTNKKFFI